MEKFSKNDLMNSARRALLYNSLPNVNSIFISANEDTLVMKVYVVKDLEEDEKDTCYSIAGEICGDFIGLNQSSVSFITGKADLSFSDDKGILVYSNGSAS